jgi:hypothetical protein
MYHRDLGFVIRASRDLLANYHELIGLIMILDLNFNYLVLMTFISIIYK